MKKYLVYELWNPIKDEPFYVGKGQDNRPSYHIKEAQKSSTNDTNRHKIHTIRKILRDGYNVDIKIVFRTKIEQDALDREIELIALYGRADLGLGPLTNMTDGGEGTSGTIRDRSGSNNGMYGKHHKEETVKTISEKRRKRLKDGFTFNHSEEWRAELRENNPGGKATAIPVYQIDGKTGQIIKEWPSANNAAKNLNILGVRKANISQCCRKYKHWRHKGFFWRRTDNPDIENGKLKNIEELLEHLEKPHSYRIIDQFDLENNIVKKWTSVKEISKELNLSYGMLQYSIKKEKIFKGFYWRHTT